MSQYKINKVNQDADSGKLTLTLESGNKQEMAFIWADKAPELLPKCRVGNIITVPKKSEWKGKIVIDDIGIVKEMPLGLNRKQIKTQFIELLELLEAIGDYSTDIMELLDDNREQFCIAPAAMNHHHNYIGGLLQHTVEVLQFAFLLNTQKEGLQTITTAAFLHDFCKIYEYSIDIQTGLITYNAEYKQKWISHTQQAFFWAMQKGYTDVAHCIAAHHGRIEWGALCEPATKEAWTVHLADMASSRLGKISVDMLED